MDGASLPFHAQPHDALRQGLASLKEDAAMRHPVESIQIQHQPHVEATKQQMLKDVYGIAFPARAQIEAQILGKFGRLPGLPSSNLGLEALNGTLDDFSFESYIGMPDHSDTMSADMHSQMEQKLGMGMKPTTKGFF